MQLEHSGHRGVPHDFADILDGPTAYTYADRLHLSGKTVLAEPRSEATENARGTRHLNTSYAKITFLMGRLHRKVGERSLVGSRLNEGLET